MSNLVSVLSVSAGTLLAIALFVMLVFWYIKDITQKKHTVLRNYPIIGRLRYFFEQMGEYFRQYFFTGERDEMPFNRATRAWVYRLAKNEGGIIGFGSTYNLHEPGSLVFVNAPFPVIEEEQLPTPPLVDRRRLVRASRFGPFGREHQRHELRRHLEAGGAGAVARRGRGRLLDGYRRGRPRPYHLEGGCDVIMQIGTAKYGVRDADGRLSAARLRELAAHETVRAFEIKLSQGAKPGKGGVLLGAKVTEEIAAIRGIPVGQDSISPNRHRDIANADELLDMVARVREATGKPVGIKTAIGGWQFMNELTEAIARRGIGAAPDFIAVDGGEGGSGAAPQALADHMALSIDEALPRVVDALIETGLRERVRVIAAGKLVTSARAAWALAAGADFVNSARGFMFALGCIQALRCHANTCPAGVTTHNPRLQRGLVVADKAERVATTAAT
jgi:glutamate synthase domain-containing protein 2